MPVVGDTRFVEFDKYCQKCEHKDTDESESPCAECLDEPVDVYSNKPVNFKEK